MKITKAIIPVAGWGTRRLPITKTLEKCMMPVGNRPVIDYVVQDCIKAGITDIYFIINEQSTQLRDYYRTNIDLNDYLRRNGKENLLGLIKPPMNINLHYITQSSYGKYGTAIPVSLAYSQINEGESVAVLMGDDFIYRRDDKSELARLIEAAGDDSAILTVPIPKEEVYKYGVIESNEYGEFVQIVERPDPESAPSNKINVSKYVLNYNALSIIEHYSEQELKSGEYQIIDPINQYVSSGGILRVVDAEGEYLDSGTVQSWLKANETVIKDIY